MATLLEIITLPFMQRALLAGLALGAILPFLGAFVVLKRMSFFGDGIAHASLAGVAIGILAGVSPFGVALAVGVAFAIAIFILERKANLTSDAIIGLIFTTGLALGVVLLSMQKGYQPELISFLFGNILTLGMSDVILIGIAAVVILGVIIATHRPFTLVVLDRTTAWLRGIPVGAYEFFFYIVLALAVVLGVKLLGIILVSALLIIPPTTAKLIAGSFKGLLITSGIAGEAAVLSGLVISYYADLPSGATIILAGASIFFIVLISKELVGALRR